MTARETNRDLILECILQHPEGVDDDQVSELSGVKPRQQVYQIATRLEADSLIKRDTVVKPGKRRKIHNFPIDDTNLQTAPIIDRQSPNSPLWKKRLAALVAATGRDEADILDEALEGFARELLQRGIK